MLLPTHNAPPYPQCSSLPTILLPTHNPPLYPQSSSLPTMLLPTHNPPPYPQSSSLPTIHLTAGTPRPPPMHRTASSLPSNPSVCLFPSSCFSPFLFTLFHFYAHSFSSWPTAVSFSDSWSPEVCFSHDEYILSIPFIGCFPFVSPLRFILFLSQVYGYTNSGIEPKS